jgi:hypothetical protein
MLAALRRPAALEVAPRWESLAAVLHGENVDGALDSNWEKAGAVHSISAVTAPASRGDVLRAPARPTRAAPSPPRGRPSHRKCPTSQMVFDDESRPGYSLFLQRLASARRQLDAARPQDFVWRDYPQPRMSRDVLGKMFGVSRHQPIKSARIAVTSTGASLP